MHEMRRKDRAMRPEMAKEILKKGEYGVLSTVGADGQPYGVPLNYALSEDGTTLWFHGASVGHKLENLAFCPKVSFTVADGVRLHPEQFSTAFQSVVVFGTAKQVEDMEAKRAGLEALIRKYSPDFLEEGLRYIERAAGKTTVLALHIQALTGKVHA